MELRQKILAEHSKAQTNEIIRWVANNQERFDQLFHLFLEDEYRVVQRAAMTLIYCTTMHPELIKKHFKELFISLHNPNVSGAVKRNTLRLLQHVDIPQRYHGQIINLCFDYITLPSEAAAVKAFALNILQNFAQIYPDIKDEVKIIIEDRWDLETPAFQSKSKKISGVNKAIICYNPKP